MKSIILFLALAFGVVAQVTTPQRPESLFNVRTYGAIGDGVADDTAAINATIAKASGYGGGIVYFPYGNYLVSSTINVTNQLLTLMGANMSGSRVLEPNNQSLSSMTNGATIIFTGANQSIISISGHYDQIKNLNLRYKNYQTSSQTGSACIYLGNETVGAVIENVSLGRGAYGIYGAGFTYANKFDHIIIEDASISFVYQFAGELSTGSSWYFQNLSSTATPVSAANVVRSSETNLTVTYTSGSLPSWVHVGMAIYASGYSPAAYNVRAFITTLTATTFTVSLSADPGSDPSNAVVGVPGVWNVQQGQMVGPAVYLGGEWSISDITTEILQLVSDSALIKINGSVNIGAWHVEDVSWDSSLSSISPFVDTGRASSIGSAFFGTTGLKSGQTANIFTKNADGVLNVNALRLGGNYHAGATLNVGATNSSGGHVIITGIGQAGTVTANSDGNYDSLGAAELELTQQAAALTYAPIASPLFTGKVTLPASGMTFADGTSQSTIRSKLVYTIVSTPSVPPIGSVNFSGDNGTNSIYAIQSAERIYFPQVTYGLQPIYIGYWNTAASSNPWTYTNSVENPLPNALEVACTFYDSGGRGYPVTFQGNRMARLNPYAWLKADAHGPTIQAGDWVRVQAWVNRLASTTNTYSNGEPGVLPTTQAYLPLKRIHLYDQTSGYSLVAAYATGLNTTEAKVDTYLSSSGNFAANGAGYGFFPSFYAGWVKDTDLKTVAAVGDSITASLHDEQNAADPASGNGYLVRALKYSRPIINLGIGGEQARQWTTNTANKIPEWRISALKDFRYDIVTVALGGNDFASGARSYAAFTNDYANVIKQVYEMTGAKIVAITPYPFQNSASGKYYGAGDLSSGWATVTNLYSFNDLLRTNPTALGPIWKVFDASALWETTTNSGVARYFTNALYSGTVTTQNTNNYGSVLYRTLIDTNASWTVNQWVDEPLQITNSSPAWPANAYVVSNTVNTLYFLWPNGVANSLVTTNALTPGGTYAVGIGAITDDGAHMTPRFAKQLATNILNQAIFP